MFVSIIIAVKNAGDLLKETLESIQVQTYPNIEVIVIDGNSTDNTLSVIQAFPHLIKSYISEADEGISDAFNKGIRLAKGDYINFQGAGDTLVSSTSIEMLFSGLDENYQLICGKIIRVQEDGQTPIWVAPKETKFKKNSLLFKMSLPHQGLFTHRSFFTKFGEFNKQIKFSMDYELLLRAYHDFPKTIVKDVLVSRWRAGGVGTNRISEILDEYHQIKLRHRIASPLILNLIHKLNCFKFFIKKHLK